MNVIDKSIFPGGPWETIAKGKLEGLEQEIYANDSGVFLTLIYDRNREGKEIEGILLNAFKVLYVKGDPEPLLKRFAKRILTVHVHSKQADHKFLLIDSAATYIAAEEGTIKKEIKTHIERLDSIANILKNVSHAYDLEFKEINELNDEEKSAFFSLPILNLLLYPPTKRKAETPITEYATGELFFGITKNGAVAKEPLDFFEKTLVFGSFEESRFHALHIVAESAMLSNLPVLIIDWHDKFKGLQFPNKNRNSLENFKVELDPIGFPCKFFIAGKDIGVQINNIDGKVLSKLFGLGKTTAAEIIEKAIEKGRFKSFEELIESVSKLEESTKITPFKKREAQRALELMQAIYPGLFVEKIDTEELFKGWHRSLTRANIVLFKDSDMRKNFLIMHSIANALRDKFRKVKSSKITHIVIVTNANKIVPEFKKNYITEKIAESIAELPKHGCAIFIEGEDKANIDKKLSGDATATIGVVSEGDAAIVIHNRRNYRVLLRPGLSNCCRIHQE